MMVLLSLQIFVLLLYSLYDIRRDTYEIFAEPVDPEKVCNSVTKLINHNTVCDRLSVI